MASRATGWVEVLDESCKQWSDTRVISQEHLRSVLLFSTYIVNLADSGGWVYDGHSFKVADPMSTLTVRSTVDGVPSVGFVSARTLTGCMHIFLRRLDEDRVMWVPDRFRG